MSYIVHIDPTDLEKTAQSYIYEDRKYHAFERSLWDRIKNYNGTFGHSMIEHLNRTSIHYGSILNHMNYDPVTAGNLASAFRFHDAGKILQPENLWGLDDKPDESIKSQRKAHTTLGLEVLEQTIDRFPEFRFDRHIAVIGCLMHHHHERINGIGPNGLSGSDLGEALEIAGIVDTVDGKTVTRGHQQTSRAQALRDMTGDPALATKDKHRGEFRADLLNDAIAYYQAHTPERILPSSHTHQAAPQPVLAL